MKIPISIYENDEVLKYLLKRNIKHIYAKAKEKLLSGYGNGLDFKLRKPTDLNIWSFRLNKKYRAYGILGTNNVLKVFKISDHQT